MISDLKLQKLICWTPHIGQDQVLNCFERGVMRIVIAAGVRWGKSAICAYIALRTFLQGISERKKGKKDSIKIWIVATS